MSNQHKHNPCDFRAVGLAKCVGEIVDKLTSDLTCMCCAFIRGAVFGGIISGIIFFSIGLAS